MAHIIEPFNNTSFINASQNLREAHRFLILRANATIQELNRNDFQWGILLKRATVELNVGEIPRLIGKEHEKLAEVINIAATVERLIDAIDWFANQEENLNCSIQNCHPSTSDNPGENDLVISNQNGDVVIRCEVCDVVSKNAGANGKEIKDLLNLGCNEIVPNDGIKRYICTAPEFANALTSLNRPWKTYPYRYECIITNGSSSARMLLIQPK
jgi:hypothetical protein